MFFKNLCKATILSADTFITLTGDLESPISLSPTFLSLDGRGSLKFFRQKVRVYPLRFSFGEAP
jgi:hypothetical protein